MRPGNLISKRCEFGLAKSTIDSTFTVELGHRGLPFAPIFPEGESRGAQTRRDCLQPPSLLFASFKAVDGPRHILGDGARPTARVHHPLENHLRGSTAVRPGHEKPTVAHPRALIRMKPTRVFIHPIDQFP